MMDTRPPDAAGQAAAIIWTTDRGLRFTSSQGTPLQEAGFTGEQFIGMSLYDFFQTEDPQYPPLAAHLRALEGESMVYEAEVWNRWWDCHIQPLHDGIGNIVGTVGVGIDATDRRRAEEALREREGQYRNIFEATSDGLGINDLETGVILEANPAFCRMHGYETMVGMSPTDFIHPNSFPLFKEYVEAIRAGGEFRCQAQDIRSDGTVFDIEVLGRGIIYQGRPAMLGVLRDVTEQVRAYQLLEERVVERTREIERRREVAEGLRELLAAVNSRRSLDEILDYVVAQTGRLLGCEASAVYLPTADGQLSVHAARGLDPAYVTARVPVGVPPTGLAFATCRPTTVSNLYATLADADDPARDLEVEERASHLSVLHVPAHLGPAGGDPVWRQGSQDGGFQSLLAVPLAVKDETYGALTLYFREPRELADDEVALAAAFADQAALAVENARLYEQAQQAAMLEERQRLARELHDAVSQTLFSTSLIAEVVPRLWETNPAEAHRRLDELRRLTRGALAEMRTLLLELRPGTLTDLPLRELLQQLAEAMAGRTGLDVTVTVDDEPTAPLPAEVQATLYRITQEALNNVARHAQAHHVDLHLSARPDGGFRLQIRDDGRGFDPTVIAPGHLGVGIMRERAAAIGATLGVESAPGQGTHIEIQWDASPPSS